MWTVVQEDGVFTIRTATGQQRTVHPADLREAIHLMPENEHQTGHDTGNQTDTPDEEQDPNAA